MCIFRNTIEEYKSKKFSSNTTIYWPLTNGKRDKNTALNKKTVISMYKRNGCFSLLWEYFIFFHLFHNQQVAGSSPASSSKGRDNLCLLFFLFQKRISKFNSQQKISLFFTKWDFVIFGVKYSKTIYWPFMNLPHFRRVNYPLC